MAAKELHFRVLIYPDTRTDGLVFIAKCLEYDIAVHAGSAEAALREFVDHVALRCQIAEKYGQSPFDGIPPAPERFHRAWDESGLKAEPSTPPAWMLSSLKVEARLGA